MIELAYNLGVTPEDILTAPAGARVLIDDIILAKPLSENATGEHLPCIGIGAREGRSNVMFVEILKARDSGKSVVYFDFESSFDLEGLGKEFLNLDK